MHKLHFPAAAVALAILAAFLPLEGAHGQAGPEEPELDGSHMTAGPSGLIPVYRFVGARTAGALTKTAVFCTTFGQNAVMQADFYDEDGTQVGSGSIAMSETFKSGAMVGHLDTVAGDVPFYVGEGFAPLSSDLTQGWVQVNATHADVVCSAVVVDSTSASPAYLESLRGVRLAELVAPNGSYVFPGVRVEPSVADAVVHCTNLSDVSADVAATFYNGDGSVEGTTGTTSISPWQTLTIATTNTALFREDVVVTPTVPIHQGAIVIPIDFSNRRVHCVAELIASSASPPPFLLTLASVRVEP